MISETEKASAEHEGRYHHYTGNAIPWYVHLIWISFWCFTAYYFVQYLIPMLQSEIAAPPS